ncbi:MAG: EFR1 family ferrodoxin [Bacteroidales bacterium]|nr:EFR1 family ferrodoxin [Bacteroidales bacterium]
MDRRNALKMMGATLATIAMAGIAPRTHAALLRDRAKDKKRLVFYFTATGNSLFVARQFSDSPLSIPQELKKTDLSYEADEIAFVCPDYAGGIPKIVREFVSKGTFKAPYIFSVITFGNACVNVAEYWDEFCQEHGVKNNYIRPILMVDNYLPVFDMNQQITIDKHTDENLATIIEEVSAHKDFIAPAEMGFFNKEMLKGMQDQHFSMTAERLVELRPDRCVQCMTCQQVCPHKNFSLGSGGLEFKGDCEYCLACIQNCPQKALTLKSAMGGRPGERNPEARYRHPSVSLNDIIRSNRQ